MQMILSIAVVVQIISAVAVIVLVLLQHGKGADLGAAFGSGASGSVFGASCRVRPPLLQRFSSVQHWPLRWGRVRIRRACVRTLRAYSAR